MTAPTFAERIARIMKPGGQILILHRRNGRIRGDIAQLRPTQAGQEMTRAVVIAASRGRFGSLTYQTHGDAGVIRHA